METHIYRCSISSSDSEIVGILVILERYFTSEEQRNTPFLLNLLDKQQTRLKAAYERHIVSRSLYTVGRAQPTDFPRLERPTAWNRTNQIHQQETQGGRPLHQIFFFLCEPGGKSTYRRRRI